MLQCGKPFFARNTTSYKIRKMGLYFSHLLYFVTKLHTFIKLRVLFPTVLINFRNSKICPIGEWSIIRRKLISVTTFNIIILWSTSQAPTHGSML